MRTTLNSPGTIVCLTDNFPFWAKILTELKAINSSFMECCKIFDISYHKGELDQKKHGMKREKVSLPGESVFHQNYDIT